MNPSSIKKAPNSRYEPVLHLHITKNLAKKQFWIVLSTLLLKQSSKDLTQDVRDASGVGEQSCESTAVISLWMLSHSCSSLCAHCGCHTNPSPLNCPPPSLYRLLSRLPSTSVNQIRESHVCNQCCLSSSVWWIRRLADARHNTPEHRGQHCWKHSG